MSLRVAVLTGRDSFYAPTVVAHLEDRPTIEVAGVFVKSLRAGRLRQLRRIAKESGLAYMAARAIAAILDAQSVEGEDWMPLRSANSESFRAWVQEHRIDLLVSVFYPEIISAETLAAAVHGGVNLHPGVLPARAGRHPVFWSLALGDEVAGVTLHVMSERVDAGDVVGVREVQVRPDHSLRSLYLELASEGGELLADALARLASSGQLETVTGVPPSKLLGPPTREAYRAFRANGRQFR